MFFTICKWSVVNLNVMSFPPLIADWCSKANAPLIKIVLSQKQTNLLWFPAGFSPHNSCL